MARAIGHQTFRTWLKTEAYRDSPVGDIARDLLNDTCWNGRISGVETHLQGHDASDTAMHVLSVAVREYRRDMAHG